MLKLVRPTRLGGVTTAPPRLKTLNGVDLPLPVSPSKRGLIRINGAVHIGPGTQLKSSAATFNRVRNRDCTRRPIASDRRTCHKIQPLHESGNTQVNQGEGDSVLLFPVS